MLYGKWRIVLVLLVLFCFENCRSTEIEDYDEEENEFDECGYEINFKTYKKSNQLDLCDALKSPSDKSSIRLEIYSNHTDEKVHIRGSKSLSSNRSLLTLTTDFIEDFKYPISILTIDNYQLISMKTLQTILSSLINADLNLLGKNLKKTLIVAKGGHKQMLSCSGTFYPKQDLKVLNIQSNMSKGITCNKEPQQDRFFTLEEKIFLNPANQNSFNLVDIHQDDPKKIVRTSWFTCNNPKSCSNGLLDKPSLDKTVNYALKVLRTNRMAKKTPSG